MSRRLLVTCLEDLAIGNVHLESLANHPVRKAQLCACERALKHFSDALLVGDFNFDSQQNWSPPHRPLENAALEEFMHGFVDVWPHLRRERGLTFDSSICPYIRKHEQMRYDRVMARVVKWVAKSIERVGHEPMDVKLSSRTCKGGLFLSDHFGLIATFSRTKISGVNFDSSEDNEHWPKARVSEKKFREKLGNTEDEQLFETGRVQKRQNPNTSPIGGHHGDSRCWPRDASRRPQDAVAVGRSAALGPPAGARQPASASAVPAQPAGAPGADAMAKPTPAESRSSHASFTVGEKVCYWSETHRKWRETEIKAVNKSPQGEVVSYNLTAKPLAIEVWKVRSSSTPLDAPAPAAPAIGYTRAS
jgi:hypothetical protein